MPVCAAAWSQHVVWKILMSNKQVGYLLITCYLFTTYLLLVTTLSKCQKHPLAYYLNSDWVFMGLSI